MTEGPPPAELSGYGATPAPPGLPIPPAVGQPLVNPSGQVSPSGAMETAPPPGLVASELWLHEASVICDSMDPTGDYFLSPAALCQRIQDFLDARYDPQV